MDSDPDIALFREDLVILKRDVASLIEHIKGGATNNVQIATNQIERHVRSLRQEAGAQGERSAQVVRQRRRSVNECGAGGKVFDERAAHSDR